MLPTSRDAHFFAKNIHEIGNDKPQKEEIRLYMVNARYLGSHAIGGEIKRGEDQKIREHI
eukprot:1122218-Pelagomonas_calceolata.AAC.1